VRVPERHLAREHGGVIGLGHRRGGHVLQVHLVLAEPVAVGMLGGELRLDLVVVDDAPLGRVDQEDPAGVQPLLDENLLGRNVEHAHLGRHDHEVVLGHVVARRPEPVAIEDGPDDGAVRERDRRRTVPRLHQR
jgi:hypothetical protein